MIITIWLHFFQQCMKFDKKKYGRGGRGGGGREGFSTIMFQRFNLKNSFIKYGPPVVKTYIRYWFRRLNNSSEILFMLEGAPPHWANSVRDWMNYHLPDHWIGRGTANEWEEPRARFTSEIMRILMIWSPQWPQHSWKFREKCWALPWPILGSGWKMSSKFEVAISRNKYIYMIYMVLLCFLILSRVKSD